MIDPNVLKIKIEENIEGAVADVTEYSGGGDHFTCKVVSDTFEGLSMIKRHQMVYALFQAEMQSGALHALSLKTVTASEEQPG